MVSRIAFVAARERFKDTCEGVGPQSVYHEPAKGFDADKKSDGIVPLSSALNETGTSAGTFTAIHSEGAADLGYRRPSLLQSGSVVARVVALLDTPVSTSSIFILGESRPGVPRTVGERILSETLTSPFLPILCGLFSDLFAPRRQVAVRSHMSNIV